MSQSTHANLGIGRVWLYVLALALLLAGAFLAIGGAILIGRGGSWYFLIAGIGLVITAVLVARARSAGVWLALLVYGGTIVWSLVDVGLDYWGLISRLVALTFITAAVVLSLPLLRKAEGRPTAMATGLVLGGVLVASGLLGFASMFSVHPEVEADTPVAQHVPVAPDQEQGNWAHYGNDPGSSRFVALDQITTDNVTQLEQVWSFQTGDIPQSTGAGAEDQLTPMQIGDKLFICTPSNNVIALDVDSGEQLWRRDFNATVGGVWERCRGLAYFDMNEPVVQPTQADASPVVPVSLPAGGCERRVLMNTIDARLVAINADNGEMCGEFGNEGIVDLKADMGDILNPAHYTMTAAPTVAGTTIVVGGRVADNVQVDMPGGVVRGFDVITGDMRWHFDPGLESPTDTPADHYQRSTPNVWAGISYDPAMNAVFLPVGSASVDLYGVTRTELDKKYGATVLAVDASTGRELWLYQTVYNDLWDFDVPMAPALIDFPQANGSRVPALVVATKAGQIFVLDRHTGEPLTDVQEQEVKPANIPGEDYAPTQPVSVGMPQIGTEFLTESDMWGATLFDQLLCRIDFTGMRYEGLYTAPDTDKSLSYPGSLGGMNWGGVSHDPNNDLLFVNDMRLGLWVQMLPQEDNAPLSDGGEAPNAAMGEVPLGGTPYAVIKDRFLSPLGIPCQKPPFGTMTAVNLKNQQVAWQVPMGTVRDTGPLGIKMRLPLPVGMPTLGGSVATQGGLLFFAGTQDYYLRALDTATGEEVWKYRLPVGSQGTPISYKSPNTGKQYVVVSAGGARQSPDRGDYVIAFALPD